MSAPYFPFSLLKDTAPDPTVPQRVVVTSNANYQQTSFVNHFTRVWTTERNFNYTNIAKIHCRISKRKPILNNFLFLNLLLTLAGHYRATLRGKIPTTKKAFNKKKTQTFAG
eukprot:Lithocolla_globosa_v1_NODE_257_length_4779_cov_60.829103.p5 type:complete len:112 gc:universal NODE_257_length_4779_cov_60.829103:4039-4374(+)